MAAASLDDWFAVNNLFIRYATSLDHCDVEAVVACFEPDGTIESPVLGRFAGAAGIRAFAQRTVRMKQEQGAQFRHVVSNLRVDVDGERASARCYLLDFRHARWQDGSPVARRIRMRVEADGRKRGVSPTAGS